MGIKSKILKNDHNRTPFTALELLNWSPYIFDHSYHIGHSALNFNLLSTKAIDGKIDVTLDSDDYNLVTNNCSDKTLDFLEYVYGDKYNPYVFTTPEIVVKK